MTFNDMCLLIACERCGQPSGQWCVSRSGRRASYLHSARSWAVQQVWIDGFHEGQEAAVGAMDSGSEWSVRYLNDIRARRTA